MKGEKAIKIVPRNLLTRMLNFTSFYFLYLHTVKNKAEGITIFPYFKVFCAKVFNVLSFPCVFVLWEYIILTIEKKTRQTCKNKQRKWFYLSGT